MVVRVAVWAGDAGNGIIGASQLLAGGGGTPSGSIHVTIAHSQRNSIQ